ncbi:MAG TPA: transglutaminase domain-containing protein [Armatimonadota bacterium]|nr:transglutaminase domain-containing protein [Armatimonadota bacterium]
MWNRWLDSNSPELKAVPLYLSVYGAYAMGACALYEELGTQPAEALALLFVAIGLAFAFWLRRAPERRWLGLVIGAAAAAAAIAGTPVGTIQSGDFGAQIAFQLVWLTLFLSFGACTDDTVLFLNIPSLAMLLASASEGSDPIISGFALGFCLMGILSLVCHAALKDLRTSSPRLRQAAWAAVTLRHSILNQWTLAALLFIITGFLAVCLIVPLRLAGDRFRPLILGTPRPIARRQSPRAAANQTAAGAFRMGQVRVGQGPIHPGKTPIFRVDSPRRLLRLSGIYTAYNSAGWEEGSDTGSYFNTPNGFSIPPDVYSKQWPIVSERVELLASSNVGPAAAPLARVDFPVWEGTPRINRYGLIEFPDVAPPHFLYHTWSYVPPDIDHLGAPLMTGARPPQVPELPHVTAEVQNLAQRLRGHDAVDTARRIVGYLQAHCSYDLNAPATPTGEDAVDFFIFKSKAGYCDLFATSAALLLQLDGVPSRYCTGYAPGHWDPQTRSQLITDAQAHAWIEVFVRGHGWIPVDPTPPGFNGPPSTSVEMRAVLSDIQARVPSISASTLLLILLTAALAFLAYSLSPFAAVRRVRARMKAAELPASFIDYWQMQRMLSRAGLPRRAHETPYEYQQRLTDCGLSEGILQPASEITRHFVEARYGAGAGRPGDASAVDALRQALCGAENRESLRAMRSRRNSGSQAPEGSISSNPTPNT